MGRKNKKGISEVTVIIVAIVIGALALAAGIVAISSDANNWSKSLTCQFSVKFRSATVGIPGAVALGKDYHLRCPVIEDKVSQEQLYQTISEEIIRCWNNVGAGKETLTDKYDVGQRDVSCVVCAQIMPKGANEELTVNPQELKNYLNKIGDEKTKGILAQLTDTQENLDYTYSTPQKVSQAKPFTIAYFIFAADTNDLKNTAEVKPNSDSTDAISGAAALTTAIIARNIGKRAVFTALIPNPATAAVTVAITVFTGSEIALRSTEKEVLVHGIFYGTGGDVESQCTTYL